MPKAIEFTELQRVDIINGYTSGLSLERLGTVYGVSPKVIRRIIIQAGLHIKPIYVCQASKANINFFETVDTEEKAYWLGFALADGYVSDDNRFVLCLAVCDIEHLKKFKLVMNSKNKLHIDKKNIVHFAIKNRKLCSDLARYGVVPRKSFIAYKSSLILKELERHFWRGCIDGDGCITTQDGRYVVLNLCGSLNLITDFRNYCCSILGTDSNSRKVSYHKKSNYYRINFIGRQAAILLNHFYNHNTVSLDRKYNKYKLLVKNRENLNVLPNCYS